MYTEERLEITIFHFVASITDWLLAYLPNCRIIYYIGYPRLYCDLLYSDSSRISIRSLYNRRWHLKKNVIIIIITILGSYKYMYHSNTYYIKHLQHYTTFWNFQSTCLHTLIDDKWRRWLMYTHSFLISTKRFSSIVTVHRYRLLTISLYRLCTQNDVKNMISPYKTVVFEFDRF